MVKHWNVTTFKFPKLSLTWRTVSTMTTASRVAIIADRTAASTTEDVDHPEATEAVAAPGRGAPSNLALTPPLDATTKITYSIHHYLTDAIFSKQYLSVVLK